MGDKHATDLFTTLFQIAGVRQNVVDARCIVFAELEAAVDNQNIVAIFDGGHVAADFFNTTQRDNADIASFKRGNRLLIAIHC